MPLMVQSRGRYVGRIRKDLSASRRKLAYILRCSDQIRKENMPR